ncbi:MAG: HupE/UreJ family protein [Pseudomonadota bacterium]
MTHTRKLATALIFASCAAGIAHAHSSEGVAGGLESGLLHPIMGPDHLVAMVAVGLWGAQLGRPLIYALPIAFPLMMVMGGLLGLTDFPLPAVEIGIAASAVVLGLLATLAVRVPTALAVAIVAAFAIFHGYAHGQELPEAASPISYGIGFVISTGLLHAAGIVIGLLNDWKSAGPWLVRGCGGIVALVGLYYLVGAVGLA